MPWFCFSGVKVPRFGFSGGVKVPWFGFSGVNFGLSSVLYNKASSMGRKGSVDTKFSGFSLVTNGFGLGVFPEKEKRDSSS